MGLPSVRGEANEGKEDGVTTNQLNTEIAKHCGYTIHSSFTEEDGSTYTNWIDADGRHCSPPDYCRDYNALMPLIAAMGNTEMYAYHCCVLGVMKESNPALAWVSPWRASAEQLAEAYVRFIGKWRVE